MLKKQFIRIFILFFICQLLIVGFPLIIHREFHLLHYINYSFYIGGLFIFTALLLYVVKKGFFDIVTKSFRTVFARRKLSKQEINEIQPVSKMITFDCTPLMMNGLLIIGAMLFTLYIYFD